MARIKTTFSDGINEYLQTLNRLGKEIEGISKQAVYEGAKIIADEIKNNIEALSTDEEWGTPKKRKTLLGDLVLLTCKITNEQSIPKLVMMMPDMMKTTNRSR